LPVRPNSMGAWESLVTGWAEFWDHRGAIGVAGINFIINLIIILLMSLSGVPLFSIMTRPSFTLPTVPPPNYFAGGYHSLLILTLAGAITVLAIAPFVMAATPGSLIDAVNDEFSLSGYFRKGAKFFWRAFGFLWLNVAVMIAVIAVSALIIFLLALLFGLILGKAASFAGIVLGILLLILPWILIFGAYTITMLRYLTNRERGLGTSISEASLRESPGPRWVSWFYSSPCLWLVLP